MAPSNTPIHQLAGELRQRFKEHAASLRNVARTLANEGDREKLLAMAREYDTFAEADLSAKEADPPSEPKL